MKHLHDQEAFTIVEVIIVLAIAGLILLIVLLAVPAMQRGERNRERKQAVGLVYGELTEFTQNAKYYPDTPQQFCNFINTSSFKSPSTTCSPTLVAGADCVLVSGKQFSICYHERNSGHEYMGPYEQINIQHGHWCGTDPDETDQYPLTDGYSGDSMTYKFAVWTPLEGGGVACTGSADRL
jgi:prepilin-type N-terminal cleavage/methylation domain-containing protein